LLHSLPVRLLLSGLLFGLSGIYAGTAIAGQKVDIYRANTLVKSQSESERNAAARATFGEVVVRVSGQRSALNHPAIKAALPGAQNYLFGFSYHSVAEKIIQDGKTVPAIGLQLNYEPKAIEQLLRQSQLPLWPATRPKVLVWLVAKDPTGLRLVPDVADLQAMQAQAQYRGLPLGFPKMDLEDSLSLSADDLWALDIEKIKAASLRYKADAILVGRYTPYSMGPIPPAVIQQPQADVPEVGELVASSAAVSSVASSAPSSFPDDGAMPEPIAGPWLGDWQLVHASSNQTFADETPDVKSLFSLAIDRAADYFANQYAIMPTDQGPQVIMLRIGNITSFAAFKQVQAYLDELAIVQRMEVMQVDTEGLLVRLTTEGDVKLLMSTLALGRRLAPLQTETITDPLANAEVAATTATTATTADDTGIDAAAMAELDQALANEQFSGTGDAQSAINPNPDTGAVPTANPVPVYGGTVENPLIYVWQK